MKLIHFADLHIGMENYGKIDPPTGLSTRLLDFLRSFDFLVDYALKHEVEAVLFAGDAYKTREPSPTYQREFAKRALRLSKKGIPVVLLVGNHDTPNVESKANTLDIYSTLELENIRVIRKPELIEIPLKSGELQIIGLPWLSKTDYEQLSSTLPMLYAKLDPTKVAVTMVHATVEGSTFGSERALTLGKDFILPLSLLTHPSVSYVALGHIHKRQVLSQNPPVVYSGSLERVDFGEEQEEKGFEVIEIDGLRRVTHSMVATPARSFITLNFDLLGELFDPTQEMLKVIEATDLQDKIVKLVLQVSAENLERIRFTEVKKAVEEKAHVLAGISKNVERSTRQRLEGVSAESLSPLEALHSFFEAKNYSEQKSAVLEKYGQELIEQLIK